MVHAGRSSPRPLALGTHRRHGIRLRIAADRGGSCGPAGGQEGIEAVYRLVRPVIEQAAVARERERDAVVPLGHLADVAAGGDQDGDEAVPQTTEGEAIEPGAGNNRLPEMAAEGRPEQRPTPTSGKHQGIRGGIDVLGTPHELAAKVDQASTAGEVAAAEVSEPTPGALDLLQACAEVGRPVVMVSNNAEAAIDTFLHRHQLRHLVQVVVAHMPGQPELMKPHPSAVERALDLRVRPAHQSVLIGDSVTDILVSRATGTRSIGLAKTPLRGRELHAAGADAVTDSVATLADLIRRSDRIRSPSC